MREQDIDRIRAWTIERGLAGDSEVDLLHGFCRHLVECGIDVARVMVVIDTLHPIYEGKAFFWAGDQRLNSFESEYGPTLTGYDNNQWLASPFYHMMQNGLGELRRRLERGETDFPVLEELRAEGLTDYFALIHRFGAESVIGEMDSVVSRWAMRRPGGYGEADLDALRRLVPALSLAIKARALVRVAETLVDTYLGRDAGQRVLAGRMQRGVIENIHSVIWFSDMQGYTALSETLTSEELIPLLDDYAEAVISAIHGAGGDVLKLIGDGVLAIFRAEDPGSACRAALRAEADLRVRLAALAVQRGAAAQPVSSIYVGLHIGDVSYGNIGSPDRLDFTVVGPAVNEASRIASLCGSADRDVLLSAAFRDALPEGDRARLVSVGRYALRGVRRPQELFTLDPEPPA